MDIGNLSEQVIAEINPFVNSPEIGSVFTARLDKEKGKRDYVTHRIKNFTGYIRENPCFREELIEGKFYRFIVVSVHSREHHNYFYAIPFRRVKTEESRDMNYTDSETFLRIKRIGERLLGIKYKKKS